MTTGIRAMIRPGSLAVEISRAKVSFPSATLSRMIVARTSTPVPPAGTTTRQPGQRGIVRASTGRTVGRADQQAGRHFHPPRQSDRNRAHPVRRHLVADRAVRHDGRRRPRQRPRRRRFGPCSGRAHHEQHGSGHADAHQRAEPPGRTCHHHQSPAPCRSPPNAPVRRPRGHLSPLSQGGVVARLWPARGCGWASVGRPTLPRRCTCAGAEALLDVTARAVSGGV